MRLHKGYFIDLFVTLRDAHCPRRGVRVVEGARLESVYTRKGIEGSNPSLSAYQLKF